MPTGSAGSDPVGIALRHLVFAILAGRYASGRRPHRGAALA
jgi:hypothetical protein